MRITSEELKELNELYRTAQTTPAIWIPYHDGGGHSPADDAWNQVRKRMKELAEKYGYDPLTHTINPITGEVRSTE